MTNLGAVCRPEVPPESLREVARAAQDSGLDPVAFVRFAAEQVRPLLP